MLALIPRFLFTITAIAPVALVYAYALFAEANYGASGAITICVMAFVLISHYLMLGIRQSVSITPLKIQAVETADNENVAFLLLYITPLFTDSVSNFDFQIIIPVAVLFLVVVMAGNNYHFNPLLNLMGWHFYKVQDVDCVTRVLISKRNIRNVKKVVNTVQITDYVLIEVEPDG